MTGRGAQALPYLYLLPAFIFFVPFVLVPFAHTVGLSFYDWDGLTQAAFIGLDNYREAFGSPLVRSAFGHAFVLIFFFGVLPVLLALPLAVSSAHANVPGGNALRTLIFLPQAISTVVVGVSWGWILALDGPLNAGIARARPRLGRGRLARELHLGSAEPRHRRHVDADRICASRCFSRACSRFQARSTMRRRSTAPGAGANSWPSPCRVSRGRSPSR